MTFKIVDTDNVRESFTSTGTTITLGGAVPYSRAFAAVLADGDTFFGVARKGAEVSIGLFTYTASGGTVAQTTPWYSTNGNAAVSFSSGAGEIFFDAPSRLFDTLNLLEITVASAATTNIGTAQGLMIAVSGTTTITSFGTSINKLRFVRFTGVLVLTHNASSLILKGGVNRTTAANDIGIYVSDNSGNWREVAYNPATPAREPLSAARTYYVGANLGAVTITIASPAVAGITAHGLSANDRVVFQVPPNTKAATITAANPAVITMANSFVAGQPVVFSSTGYLPTGITAGTTYYVIATGLSGSSFQVSATVGGAAVNTTAVTATFTNGSQTITAGATDNLVVGQIVRFAGTSVVNFSNATDYYVKSTPSGTTFTVSATADGTAITAGAVTSNGTLVQAGSHFCSQTGALPTGVTEGTAYYVIATGLTANAFQFSTSQGGSAVNTSGSVTGGPLYSVYTGSDSNNGLAQTRAGAFLTMQKAINTVYGLDIGTNNVTIQCADGTYTAGGTANGPWLGSGTVTLQGNTTTPGNCLISVSGQDCIRVQGNGVLYVGGFKLVGASAYGLYATDGGSVLRVTGKMEFGVCARHVQPIFGAFIGWTAGLSYTISGGATFHYIAAYAGFIDCEGVTITVTGTPAFTYFTYVAQATQVSDTSTFTGSATGQRYNVSIFGSTTTAGGGANFYPGNAAGSATGGSYS